MKPVHKRVWLGGQGSAHVIREIRATKYDIDAAFTVDDGCGKRVSFLFWTTAGGKESRDLKRLRKLRDQLDQFLDDVDAALEKLDIDAALEKLTPMEDEG